MVGLNFPSWHSWAGGGGQALEFLTRRWENLLDRIKFQRRKIVENFDLAGEVEKNASAPHLLAEMGIFDPYIDPVSQTPIPWDI